jgi:uncharacterized protein YrrD
MASETTRSILTGRDAKDLVSMPVVATAEGRQLGKVKDVLFDPAEQALVGLMVSPSSDAGTNMFLAQQKIRGIGGDAVTVDEPDALVPVASDERARAIVESNIHLTGTRVLTETGDSLGRIDAIIVDDEGQISGYRASTGVLGFGQKNDIRRDQVLRVGEDAIIVDATAAGSTDDATATPSAGTDAETPEGEPRVRADESMER